jgi:hypothetical protein
LEPLRPISFRGAAIVGLLAVVLRLVVMAAPPKDLDYAGHVWVEEFLRGNIAWEVLHGPVIPLQDHQIPFWGGMLVVGLMAVPTFAVLGPTLFALRLATLPFSFVFAAAGFLLLDRLVSRRAAWIGGLLLALAPPGLVYTSVLAQGTHCEQTAIGLLLLWLYSEHVKRGLSSLRLAFAVGLVFGFHVTFGAAQILPLVLLFDFARDRRFFLRREFAVRAAGILVGALPFIRYELDSGGEAHKNYDLGPIAMITPHSLSESADKLARLPFDDFARSFWFEEAPAGGIRWMGIAAGVALVSLYAVALHARRAALFAWIDALLVPLRALASRMLPVQRWKKSEAPLDPIALVLVLPAVWLLLYALTPLRVGPRDWIIGYRYLLVPQVFLFLTAAIGADVLWSKGTVARRSITLGLAAWLFACTISTIVRCDFAHASALRQVPGARPEGVARVVLWKHGTLPGPLESFVESVRERRTVVEQDELYYELASLLRTGLAQVVRNGITAPAERSDPRRALRWTRDHVPDPFRSWFDVPESGPPDPLPVRRPGFGVTPH